MPLSLLPYCSAPSPFIVGLRPSEFEALQELEVKEVCPNLPVFASWVVSRSRPLRILIEHSIALCVGLPRCFPFIRAFAGSFVQE